MPLAGVDPAEQWQGKGGGLAGAGLSGAEQIVASQQDGDALLLDRRWFLIAEVVQCLELIVFDAQGTKVGA